MRFNTQKYRQLELFIKTEPGETGRLYMVSGSARKMFQISQYRKWLKITVNPGTTYEVSAENCEISYAYLSGCEQMLERGICMIRTEDFMTGVSGVNGMTRPSVTSTTFPHQRDG